MSHQNSGLQPASLQYPVNRRTITCLDCGKEANALDMGKWTRKYCNECAGRRAKDDAELLARARQEDEDRRYRDLINRARIPPDLKDITFQSADGKINPPIFQMTKNYAEEFDPHQSRSLVMFSRRTGTGKTYLAACIANHVLHVKKMSVRFQEAAWLLLDIRRTYTDGSQSEAALLDQVLRVDLLVLDDVGVAPMSAWVEDLYSTLFNRRLELGLPVVVTTNKPFIPDGRGDLLADRIGERAESRLKAMCGGAFFEFKGKDLR